MSATVDYLPVWKRNASASDRFDELAAIARKHPERFTKVVVAYQETLANGCTVMRQISSGCETLEVIGMLRLAEVQLLEDTRK